MTLPANRRPRPGRVQWVLTVRDGAALVGELPCLSLHGPDGAIRLHGGLGGLLDHPMPFAFGVIGWRFA